MGLKVDGQFVLPELRPDPPPPPDPRPTEEAEPTQGEPALVVRALSTVQPEPIHPLFGGRLLLGKLAALAGDGGVGKSYLMHAVAACLTTSVALPGDEQPAGPWDVLFASYEDEAADTIRPRLAALGADLDRVHVIQDVDDHGRRRPFTATDVASLDTAVRQRPQVGLVVIDPVAAWVGAIDEHRQNEVRACLKGLRLLAAEHGVAVVIVMHLRKATADKALHRLNGSGAYGQLVRSALVAAEDPDRDDGACAVAHVKHNLTAKAPTLGYHIDEQGRFHWLEERSDLDGERLAGHDDGDERTARGEAEAFLRDTLAHGPRPARQVLTEASHAGIPERTLKRAKKRLGVRSGKAGMDSGWSWSLPDD